MMTHAKLTEPEEGKYLIIWDSGYEQLPLDYYYCGIENEN